MSAFSFDPFTSAPAPVAAAPASSSEYSNAAAAESATPVPPPPIVAAINPFDNFGFVQSSGSNNNRGANNKDWQQTARAAMMSGNAAWKNSLGGGGNDPLGGYSSGSFLNQSTARRAKRIVPYASPISTLEANWDPYLFAAQSSSPRSLWTNGGNIMNYLVVKANEGCCLRGGVESVLRWSRQRGGAGETELSGKFGGSLSFSESQDDHSTSIYGSISSFNGSQASSNLGSGARPQCVQRTPSSGGVGGSMRFLKSGLKKAQQSFERSVTTMAIKADGGKNPDQLCVSLHYCGRSNAGNVNLNMWNALGLGNNTVVGQGVHEDVGDICLSRTEWVELPITAVESCNGDGVLFSIPLCVPDLSFLEAASASNATADNSNCSAGVNLKMRLMLRSGAALLKAVANAGLKREYCIGESVILYSNIMQLMNNGGQQQQQSIIGDNKDILSCGSINVPFINGILAETSSFSPSGRSSSSDSFHGNSDAPAALHVTAIPRIKLSPPCTHGWSLTDPVTIPPTRPSNWLKMFQLPLDQAYVFNMPHHHLHRHSLENSSNHQRPDQQMVLVNERATESSVILPLAAACTCLFSLAASHSRDLALATAEKTRRNEMVHPLPLEEAHGSEAVEAAQLDECADVELGAVALVLQGESPAQIDLGYGICGALGEGGNSPMVKMSLMFQPPHTIFEESLGAGSCPVLDEEMGGQYTKGPSGAREVLTMRFCTRIFTELDNLLPGLAGTRLNGKYVGSIRLEVRLGYVNSVVDTISNGISGGVSVEGLVELENYLDHHQQQGRVGKQPVLVPAVDSATGRKVGTFVLLLRVASHISHSSTNHPSSLTSPSSPSDIDVLSANSGLVSMVGLNTPTEGLGLQPYLDFDSLPPELVASLPTPDRMRRRQAATMGSFVTVRFLQHQANVVRSRDAASFSERHNKYYQSVMSGISPKADTDDESDVPLYRRHAPRPFRPSHSRGDTMLAGIGFNVHIQSLSLNIIQGDALATETATTQSVTHGAPADHARGFGGQVNEDGRFAYDSPVVGDFNDSAPRGGLRRLEGKRLEFAKELDGLVVDLISSVGEHFRSSTQAAAMRQQAGIKLSRHIPPDLPVITHYRTKAMECLERLHCITWDIAVRRANCFSQALGIAVTSYLGSLSDGGPAWRGFASIWARHGYLITFEGLLSAVGKELGMIEDASVAISMLRMVSLVLVPHDEPSTSPPNGGAEQRIPVPHSPYIRWVHLIYVKTPSGSHPKTKYRLDIGLDPSYYHARIPDPLKNGTPVRLFPVLFQMGVDIRQWGVNAGRSVTSQIKDKSKGGGIGMADFGDVEIALEGKNTEPNAGILDDGDEDDEGVVADNEILMALNVEGCRKLNAYAHSVNPTLVGVTSASAPAPMFDLLEQPPQQVKPLPIHSCLVPLSEAIRASAGKMEHSVLDRAASACQRLGGGSTVFCKSGKDRTAMQVTFKQAQFVQRFMDRKEGGTMLEDTPISYKDVFTKSSLMRKHGNRIPICEKNAGEPKFAFNPLQRKFMPEMLRPEASLCTWSKPET